MKLSETFLVQAGQKTASKETTTSHPADAPEITGEISQLVDNSTKTVFSPILNRMVNIRGDGAGGVFVDEILYAPAEIEESKGLSQEAMARVHLVKEVFEGTIGGEDPAPFNPLSCKYAGGEERGIHPEVCRWHAARNDRNCHECIKFSAIRQSVLNERKEKYDGRDTMAG